ncbi:unnamed protein product [Vitrella brassicaformis CCMP3155]|uniref:Uncharacterized protein n=2 Tax=Vitrella brassicaformis TaxID=1169539 RepID=A0A0G4G953_VITBC|nr:unnamed protein product [Vitrella brassicaformis CCMP3155]|eukprot:CEM25358.1 unnamed protein product [Vitrella brassicaformis CCMP3155]
MKSVCCERPVHLVDEWESAFGDATDVLNLTSELSHEGEDDAHDWPGKVDVVIESHPVPQPASPSNSSSIDLGKTQSEGDSPLHLRSLMKPVPMPSSVSNGSKSTAPPSSFLPLTPRHVDKKTRSVKNPRLAALSWERMNTEAEPIQIPSITGL